MYFANRYDDSVGCSFTKKRSEFFLLFFTNIHSIKFCFILRHQMNETLKTRFGLTDMQIAELVIKIDLKVIEKALELTKHDNRDMFKMNLMIAQRYYKNLK